ncbi:F-box associated domain type 3 [Arabidopsis suecica]|uniref:F-box associated ubiquitination effector family protein n=2 Tax=Arabidopsis TaxID=3701 RepID=F4K7U3_ARATH|nr:F-box associated ubiquitination effector family protein [Arabidopsis thaliana]AED97665.1 F-box associated ubiquitination effector family protein [Arabidopsis thaliana]KAG7613976.1 F-box associated domain type 3 [Arabidopsis suecica]|eukprot:NP_201092.2 F-box associated ubiquitination effector family protein [Arabidopsis thaliana]
MKRGRQEKKTSRSPKRRQQRQNEISERENSNGIHIPFDVITDILSRLPVKSLVKHDRWSNSCDGLFGYDPVEKQVFTLVGGPMKQQWRSLDIQGIWNHSPEARSSGLCIKEFIYYIAHVESWDDPEFYELVRFDVRHESFDRIQMPITLQMNQQLSEVSFDELTLVNYQGKLGCIRYTKASAEMWIMEDHIEQQEWSKMMIFEKLGIASLVSVLMVRL